MGLENIIIQKIKETGPIPFRDFMEMALYYPGLGYYTSSVNPIGKRGDFYTAPYLTPAFGAMIGRQLEEMMKNVGSPCTVVEYGAGTGMLCRDILQYLKINSSCYDNLQYVIIEKSPALRRISQQFLREKVRWVNSLEELGCFQGCILSNELLDNFPTQPVIMQNRLMKLFVDYHKGFREIWQPAGIKLSHFLTGLPTALPEGFRTEICEDISGWYGNIGRFLSKGYLITIDYGHSAAVIFNEMKSSGSLRCYYQHMVHDNPFIHIGRQDITADVNFTSLNYWGSIHGFSLTGYVNQALFLRALGFLPWLDGLDDSGENKTFAANMLLNQMGNLFKVIIQQKNLPEFPLTGLSFQQPAMKKMLTATTGVSQNSPDLHSLT